MTNLTRGTVLRDAQNSEAAETKKGLSGMSYGQTAQNHEKMDADAQAKANPSAYDAKFAEQVKRSGLTQTVSRETQIPASLGELRASIARLENLAADLFQKLQPVLAQNPTEGKTNGSALGYSAPLADAIQSETNRVNRISEGVLEMLQRLEV